MNNHVFRAWNKENKNWLLTKSGGESFNSLTKKLEYTYSKYFTIIDWETLRTIGSFPACYEINQAVGNDLFDKNKNQFFEGDICQLHLFGNGEEKGIYEIVYSFGEFLFRNIENDDYENLFLNKNHAKIIGNRYENPELFEVKK